MVLASGTKKGAPHDRHSHHSASGLLAGEPAWQFGPGGSIPAGVRNAVKAARALGMDETRLAALLRRPVGLVGGARLLDLLFEGHSDYVLDAVRNAAAA